MNLLIFQPSSNFGYIWTSCSIIARNFPLFALIIIYQQIKAAVPCSHSNAEPFPLFNIEINPKSTVSTKNMSQFSDWLVKLSHTRALEFRHTHSHTGTKLFGGLLPRRAWRNGSFALMTACVLTKIITAYRERKTLMSCTSALMKSYKHAARITLCTRVASLSC